MCRYIVAFVIIVIFANLDVCMIQMMPGAIAKVIGEATYENTTHLYENILIGYDKRVKPRRKQTEFVEVYFSFRILGITEFDTASQKLSILGFFYFQWRDEILSWAQKSYGGTKIIKLPLRDIWSPGMKFIRDFHGSGTIGDLQDGIILTNTGDAIWTPEGIFNVICDVKTKYYPFDQQSCVMSIYAADAALSEVSILPSGGGVSLEAYKPNSEWNLINVRVENASMFGAYFNDIIIDLERRTEFLIYTVVSPLVLLSILNVGIFIVPIDSGEKGSIAVTLFLSYGIFVTAIKDELPHNSLDVSYFLIYIQVLLVFSVFTVLYCFAESWIFSEHAEDTVSSCCFMKNKNVHRDNRIHTLESLSPEKRDQMQKHFDDTDTSFKGLAGSEDGKEKENSVTERGRNVTWRQLLRWIDIGSMLLSVCVVSVATSVFFYFLSRRTIV